MLWGAWVFEWGIGDPTAQNREFSAFYLAFVPKNVIELTTNDKIEDVFQVTDTVGMVSKEKEEIALELRLETVGDLVQDYRENQENYADGVGRILARLAYEPGTMYALNQQLIEYYK